MFKHGYKAFLFEERGNYLFKIDPRTKLIKAFLVMIFSIIISQYIILAILFLIITIELIVLGGVIKKLLRGLLILSPLIAIIFIANYLVTYNIFRSIIPLLRFLIFIFAIDIFFLTTNPDDFALTLEYFKFPLTISLSFALALRFIPTLSIKLNDIVEAQLSRGLRLDQGNILARIKNYLPIIIPLIVTSIKKSIEVAEALEIRGLEPNVKRVPYRYLKMTRNDLIYLAYSIFSLAIIYVLPQAMQILLEII